jgi:hypothetical protein
MKNVERVRWRGGREKEEGGEKAMEQDCGVGRRESR